jgi:RNA polymerase sigma-70 factor (ECF subfamily)
MSFSQLRTEKKHRNNLSFEEDIYKVEDRMLKGLELRDSSHFSDEVFLRRERMEIIENAIYELPVPYRAVFHLRDVEGLTNAEVAEILNLSIPNVKSRIYRARLFLRGKLSDYFYE